jgi:putative tricarboxylic transport membrane protein
MLLPITFGLPPVGALIMLAGIYWRGAQWRLDDLGAGHPG